MDKVDHCIYLSQYVVDGIELALGQDFQKVETPERMAWVVMLLKRINDNETYFPRGKWATIQHIEQQLEFAADIIVKKQGGNNESRPQTKGKD